MELFSIRIQRTFQLVSTNQDIAVFVKTDNFSTKTDKLNTQNIYWSINRSLIGHWNIKSFGGYKSMHFYD